MANLSCPSTDLNFLNPNGFRLLIERLPNVSFFAQEAELPSISLGTLTHPTSLTDLRLPENKLTFEPLVYRFIVDSRMDNWFEVFKWLRGLGHPEEFEQYTTENMSRAFGTESSRNFSQAELMILGSGEDAIKKITFVDCFPTLLSGINFTTTATDVVYATASLTMSYSYFKVE